MIEPAPNPTRRDTRLATSPARTAVRAHARPARLTIAAPRPIVLVDGRRLSRLRGPSLRVGADSGSFHGSAAGSNAVPRQSGGSRPLVLP
ncbi:MAG TPA: hypothetical protein VIJ00_13085 [Nakamurella sp.]